MLKPLPGDMKWDADSWNRIRIRANGPRVQQWVNGVLKQDVSDPGWDVTGQFAFEMWVIRHGEINWRNIRLKRLPEASSPDNAAETR